MRTLVPHPSSLPVHVERSATRRLQNLTELAVVVLGFAALTVALTWPLALSPGGLAYEPANGDGQFSVWVVAWVARTLIADPVHVFDANIFYPHQRTLLYSEPNLGAGALAIPVYWATKNPYAAHNVVLLLSFVLAATSMYYLARHLGSDRLAAFVSAVAFAFCPYVFGHLLHIHLLMTAGLPLGMLALHRLADRPTARRGAVLGLVMAAQGFAAGYYAIFIALMVGYAALVTAAMRRLWASRPYWSSLAVAALVAVLAMLPQLIPLVALQRDMGFSRSLEASRQFSANWRAYVSSGKTLHAWLQGLAGRGQDLLFPGMLVTVFGSAGAVIAWRSDARHRETAILYGTMAGLAFWASLGPRGGLYRLLYTTLPAFSLMRAPSRFGLIVVLALSALGAVAITSLLAPLRRRVLVGIILGALAVAESVAPLRISAPPQVGPAYRQLATLPDGALLELPVYSRHLGFVRARYMVDSTSHWKPLVDAYSDFIPPDFLQRAEMLGQFPTREGLKDAARTPFRYAMFHLDKYQPNARMALFDRLDEFAPCLRRLYGDDSTLLYEIIGCS
jgi:hypothetical protein